MAVAIAALCMLAALPGLCTRRFGRGWPRLMAAVALVVFFTGVLDPNDDAPPEKKELTPEEIKAKEAEGLRLAEEAAAAEAAAAEAAAGARSSST